MHGGKLFSGPVLIDPGVRQQLAALTDLAPLHQPKSLAALDAVQAILPDVPAVACFDTAFHATIPAFAATFALPAEWRERWGLRRFGFHGLSHAYALGGPRKYSALIWPSCVWSPAIWAPARRWRGCQAGVRWTPRWASLRSMAW